MGTRGWKWPAVGVASLLLLVLGAHLAWEGHRYRLWTPKGAIKAASEEGVAVIRGRPLTPEQINQRRRSAIENDLARFLTKGYHGPWWTRKELALLGKLPDEEVARRTGRTLSAVRSMRYRRGIPIALDRRRRR